MRDAGGDVAGTPCRAVLGSAIILTMPQEWSALIGLLGGALPALIGFASGVGVSVVGAILTNWLSRKRDRRRAVEERRFEIYRKLHELQGSYVHFASAEFFECEIPPEEHEKCRVLAWQCADLLRSADEVDLLEEILDVIFGDGFRTAQERYDVMGQLLDRLGNRISPRFQAKMRQIDEANRRRSGVRPSNAPT
jgi:hypothetical protein